MRTGIGFALLIIVVAPISACGCEPILPLTQLLSGSSSVGPLFWKESLWWLGAAIAVKSLAFAFFERRFTWRNAVSLMFVANIVSTIPGILVAVFTGSIAGFFLAIPLIFLLGMFVGNRLSSFLKDTQKPWLGGGALAISFTAFFFLSVAIYVLAEAALAERGYALYWLIKFIFVVLVASTGILISSALEESVIGRLTRVSQPNALFLRSVVRANYVTLILVLLVAAIEILPKRLSSPHFLASFMQTLFAATGLS